MSDQKFGYGRANGLRFLRRRCMLQNVDRAGKTMRRWSGWYLVEAYDCNTGQPTGVYFAPPSYEDFGWLYAGGRSAIGRNDFDRWEDTSREVCDDVEVNPVEHLGRSVTSRVITGMV